MAASKSNATYVDHEKVVRCWWCAGSDSYIDYHDRQWGWPVADDRTLFEKICLEGFQAGLSWLTILNKRENFRRVFHNFEINRVAAMRSPSVDRLLRDPGIVRHRGKIESTINNAKRAQEIVDEFGSLAAFFWQFEPRDGPQIRSRDDVRTTCDEAIDFSKQLKRRGWSFVGPTTCYAFMQAMGMVNDHASQCFVRRKIKQARRDFVRPA